MSATIIGAGRDRLKILTYNEGYKSTVHNDTKVVYETILRGGYPDQTVHVNVLANLESYDNGLIVSSQRLFGT